MGRLARVSSYTTLLISMLSFSSVALADAIDDIALEAYLEGVIDTSMKDNHIAGAVVGIMVDNKVIIKKGCKIKVRRYK